MDQIRERINDAQILWAQNRREGAILMILVAFAARARIDFPFESDSEAFCSFFQSRMSVRMNVEYLGKPLPIELIFYKWLRCELVHNGGIPTDIKFVETKSKGELSVRAGGAPDYELLLSTGWFDTLLSWCIG